MSLTAGIRLGPYEVVSPVGKGGMGEIYRARDTKLGLDVAIKVLPEEFADDEERVDRVWASMWTGTAWPRRISMSTQSLTFR